MEQTLQLASRQDRITVIDALRGFALFGVMWIHMQQRFGIRPAGAIPWEGLAVPWLDGAVQWLTTNLFMGRFINIFAFLFGMSFFIQMDRASRKGVDFRGRFLWRMVVLAAIGIVGSWFAYVDILTIYAFFGVLLVVLHPLRNKTLLLIAVVILAGAPRWAIFLQSKQKAGEKVERVERAATAPRTAQRTAQWETEPPTFWHEAQRNMTDRFMGKLNYQFGIFGRGYLTFALFILGLIVGRIRFFETAGQHPRRNLWLLGAALAVWLAGMGAAALLADHRYTFGSEPTALNILYLSVGDLNSFAMSAVLVLIFVILYERGICRKTLDTLSPYGRMGLTNYELQGIIGAFLFSGWALGKWFGGMPPAASCLVGIVFYLLQMVASKGWLACYKYGPWEWFWRSATYLRWQPMRKGK